MKLSMMTTGTVALLTAAAVGTACGDSGAAPATTTSGAGTTTSASGSGGQGGSEATPTFHADVAPILTEHCVSCHAAGNIGPFPLDTYEDVVAVASLVKTSTLNRTMPPFRADNSGQCNTYAGAAWLSDAELATIAAWVDGGTPEGDPSGTPKEPPKPPGLTKVDLTLDMGLAYEPPTSAPDDYRCFLVDPGLTTTKYLTGYDVKPGDPRVVHHVVVFVPTDDASAAQAAELDQAEAGPGWSCFGGAGVNATLALAWAPGVPATNFPKGTGLELPAGRKVVLQLHYNVEKGSFPDRTKVELALADSVAHVARVETLVDLNLSLPPKLADAKSSFQTIVDQKRTVYGVFPHQHVLGKSLRLTRESSGAESCVLDVPRWDFNWQLFYFYEKPLEFLPGDRLTLDCRYDTLSKNTPTNWGEGTNDEMCVTLLYVTKEGPTCNHCGPQLEGTPWPPTNLCKGSDTLFDALDMCVCKGSCASACGDSLCQGQEWPSEACQACIDASCSTEAFDCRNDHHLF